VVASETELTSILEVLLAELLGDVVVVLAVSDAVAVVVVAPAGGGRPPREPRRRDRGGGGQERAPGGGGGGAAQRERHGERSVWWRGVGEGDGSRLGFTPSASAAGDWRCRMDNWRGKFGKINFSPSPLTLLFAQITASQGSYARSGPIDVANKAGGRPS
jgi:hypothetical protein